ncbi:GtrA family protein [Rathayibacter toxicus]|uniref:GtrA family protein n=2 Tax=Rathayibacter toxicus TaxID=145458 RepID=A0A2S5Y4U7_9MICO|nr:GtrA family protein [Rathayibacter toxicus]PPG45675.1 GtrA family protein [Rathayibacter toxicus]PPH21624.1 GtrA family protein [Rathayibacter toxicus]PPH56054.1 GtrA family protein [Rathayibacter toxicus]PPH58149.1 GtrA family protein [Rathayibacter toxicus]
MGRQRSAVHPSSAGADPRPSNLGGANRRRGGTGSVRMKRLCDSQKIRFLIAGCGNTAIDFLILNTLTLILHMPVLGANVVSVLIGITISYGVNHIFVFRHPGGISLATFAKFFLVTGFSSLVLQSVIIWGFEMFFHTRFGHSLLFLPSSGENAILAVNVAKAAAVFVGLVWNFCMYRFVVFRRRAEEQLPAIETISPAAVAVSTEPLDVVR